MNATKAEKINNLIAAAQDLLDRVVRQRQLYDETRHFILPEVPSKTNDIVLLGDLDNFIVSETKNEFTDEDLEELIKECSPDLNPKKTLKSLDISLHSMEIIDNLVDWHGKTSFLTISLIDSSLPPIIIDFRKYLRARNGSIKASHNSASSSWMVLFHEEPVTFQFTSNGQEIKDWQTSGIKIDIQLWISPVASTPTKKLKPIKPSDISQISETHDLLAQSSINLQEFMGSPESRYGINANLLYSSYYLRKLQTFKRINVNPRKLASVEKLFATMAIFVNVGLNDSTTYQIVKPSDVNITFPFTLPPK